MTPEGLVQLALSREPTLGRGRMVCLDGPAGSGKTTLAAAISRAAESARVVHLDDLYDGWSGLAGLDARLGPLLRPLARGEAGSYRRYDWDAAGFAETVTVEPSPLLVLEGVGAGAAAFAELHTVLVWTEADPSVREGRGLQRDGAAFAARWQQWAADESELFARERTRERADVVIQTGPRL